MEVGVQHHAPGALHSRKDTIPIVKEAGWAPRSVWTFAEVPFPPEFDPRTFQPVASRYTDCAMRVKKWSCLGR
jgi:hypothetical protein